MKRAKLFYQPTDCRDAARMRIIYPNGKCEYIRDTWIHQMSTEFDDTDYCNSCFNIDTFGDLITKKQKNAIKLMNEYDKEHGWPKAWYLGEI